MNFSERWTTFRGFLSDVKKETGKVSWPDRDEVVGTTMVVIVYTSSSASSCSSWTRP